MKVFLWVFARSGISLIANVLDYAYIPSRTVFDVGTAQPLLTFINRQPSVHDCILHVRKIVTVRTGPDGRVSGTYENPEKKIQNTAVSPGKSKKNGENQRNPCTFLTGRS